MNNKYKELYNYLLDNKMTSLDENSFYNEYSQNDNKFSELYSYLQTNKMTSLDPETFKLEYFGTPIIKKKSQVESTESDLEDGSLERLSTTTTRQLEPSIYILPSNPGALYRKKGDSWLKKIGENYIPLSKGDVRARERILDKQAVLASDFQADWYSNQPKEIPESEYATQEQVNKAYPDLPKESWKGATVTPIDQTIPTEKTRAFEQEEAKDSILPEEKIEPATYEGKLYMLEEGKDNENFYKNPVTEETYLYWLDNNGKPREGLDPIKSQEAVDLAANIIGESQMNQLSKINKIDKIDLNKRDVDKFLKKELYGSNFGFNQEGNELTINSYFPGMNGDDEGLENSITIDLSKSNSSSIAKEFLRYNLFTKKENESLENIKDTESYIDAMINSNGKIKMTSDRVDVISEWARTESMAIENDIKRNEVDVIDKDIKSYEEKTKLFKKRVASGNMTQQEFDKENDDLSKLYKDISIKQKRAQELSNRAQKLISAEELIQKKVTPEEKGSTLGALVKSFTSGMSNLALTGLDYSLAAGNLIMGDEKFSKLIDGNYGEKKAKGLTDAQIANAAQATVKDFAKEKYDLGWENITETNKEYIRSENRGMIPQALNAVAESFGTAATGGALGKVGSTAAFFSMSYNAMEDQMRGPDFDHLNENEKKLISVPYGLVIGQMEKWGFDVAVGAGKNPLFNKFANYIVTKTFKNLPKNAGLIELNSAIQKNIGASIAKGLIKITGAGVSEGNVEFMQQEFEGIQKFAVNEILKNDNFNEEYFKDAPDLSKAGGWSALLDQGVDAFKLGFLAGGMTSTGASVKDNITDISSNNKFDIYKSFVLNTESRNGWIASIKEDEKNGKISPEEMNKKIDELNKSYSVLTKIPASLTTQSQREAFSLLQEREIIQNEIKDKDPNLVVKETNRIKEINEALKTTSENATKEDNIKQQEGTAEGGISEYQGTGEGQQKDGVSEGGQREATINETDRSDSTVASKVQQEVATEVVIDKPIITTNTTAEVQRVKSLTPESEDGATFNIDGTKYEGVGLVVPVDSMNTTTEELTPEMVADFVAERQKMIGDAGVVKAGIYKFPNSNQVSIDLSVVVPETSREQALEFARLAGQESLFDLETFENIKTGATGENPMKFTPEQHREISKALKEGRMPNVFGATTETTKNLLTKENVNEVTSKQTTPKNKLIVKAAKMVLNAIPGVKIYIHNNGQEMASAIESSKKQLTKEEKTGLTESSGLYVDGDIHINLESATIGTVYHEAFHALIEKNGMKSGSILLMAKGLKNIISDKGVKQRLDDFVSQYNEDEKAEEYISELGGILSEAEQELTTTKLQQFKTLINNIAKKLGLPVIFSASATAQDAADFINTMSKKLRTGEKIKDLSAEGEDSKIKKQAVDIMKGKESLEKFGLKKGKNITRKIGESLEARQRSKYGTISQKDNSPEARKKISNWMVDEVKYFIELMGDKSGKGWYGKLYQKSLDRMSKIFPEMKTDQNARDLFTMLVAITSDGQKVMSNFKLASFAYDYYNKNGVMPKTLPGQRVASFEANLKRINDLLNKYNGDIAAIKKDLMEVKSISEINKERKIEGLKPLETSWPVSFKAPFAASVFGPKLGMFYSNLSGNEAYPTLDRWWSRTFNRYRGTLIPSINKGFNKKGEAIGLDRFKKLLEIPGMSNEEALLAVKSYRDSYASKGYKNGTEIEKAANTIYKTAFENLNDAPFGKNDRQFMYDTVSDAVNKLNKEGYDLSIADVQAILWYFEKNLYKTLGVQAKIEGISYEDAANYTYENWKSAGEKFNYDIKAEEEGSSVQNEDIEDQPSKIKFQKNKTDKLTAPVAGNKLFNEPLKQALDIAKSYMKSIGKEYIPVEKITKLDEDRAKNISDAFDEMKDDPTIPEVKAAYEAMAKETLDQYDAITAKGYKLEINNNEPYSSSEDMINDLRDNNRMKIFSTESGFGEKPITDKQREEDIRLKDSGRKDVNGETLLVNDVFRFVHDFFGHAKLGNSFGPIGEENAWRVHSEMYSPEAKKAMTTETRGQNSWVNFSGVNDAAFKKREKARQLREEGKIDQANQMVGEVYDEMKFADQKIGLLPSFAVEEGAPSKIKKQLTTDKYAKPGAKLALDELGETNDQREAWRKNNKVNQKQKRNPIVEQAVKDYYNEKINQEQYLDIVAKNQPIKPFKTVPALPSLEDITNSLDISKVATGIIGLTKNLENGEKVASRLDIPAYEDYDTWVVSLHDGNKEGKSIAYGQTAVLKNVDFKTFPGSAIRIAMGTQNKSTIGRMFGDWVNEDPELVHARAKELINDPAWTQVGMNPFRYSWFYDKSDGMPVASADEVIQVGALVLAKNAKKVLPSDPIFETKSAKGGKIKFQKKAPSVDKILGTPKPSTVTVKEKTALKDQIKLEARAAREAKGDLNQKRKLLSTAIKGLVKLGKLTTRQAAIIIDRIGYVNLDNQVMVGRLADYAARVFEKADYQERLSRAFSFRKGIRKLLKGDIQAEVVGMAKKFSKIDPSMVDDIEKYLEMAEIVKNAIKPSRVNRKDLDVNMRESMNIDSVSEFTNDAIENQERILKEELLAVHSELVDAGVIDDKMSLSEIESTISSLKEKEDNANYKADILTFLSKRIDTMSAIIKDILIFKINPMTGEDVALTEKNIDLISRMLNIDINNVSIKEAIFIAEAMDNFINNNITSSVEAVIEKHEGATELENLIADKVVASPLRKYFVPKAGQYSGEAFSTMTILFEKLFVGTTKALMIAKKMGWTALVNGANKAEKLWNTAIDTYFRQYSKTNPNGKSFNDAENVYERGMLAFLSRNVSGTVTQQAEEFKRRIEVLKESIKSLLEGSTKEQKMGKIYQKVYDKLNVESGDIDVIHANADKINRSAVGWWINQWGTTYSDLSDISLSVYNTVLSSDTSYTTDRYKLLGKSTSEEIIDPKTGSFGRDIEFLDKNKAGVMMPSTKPSASAVSNASRYISLDFDVNNTSAYKGALIDINTAAAIRKIDGFINSDNLAKLIPVEKDRKIFTGRIKDYILAIKNKRVSEIDSSEYLDQLANFLGGIGVGKALGSMDQVVKQTLPIALSTLANSGRLDVVTPASAAWINSLGMELSNRGQESQSTIESVDRRLDQAVSGVKIASRAIVDLQQAWLKFSLSKPDVWIAYSSFISYYKQYLSDNNQSTDIDWATHNVNQDAADYAMWMVNRQQNVSDTKTQGKIFTSTNSYTKVGRKMLLPFASFSLNQKSRMISDIKTLGFYSGASKQDRAIAARSLFSLPFEMALYQGIGLTIRLSWLALAGYIVGAVSGDDDDEEKERLLGIEMSKEMKNATKYPLRSLITDFLSPVPPADQFVVGAANYLLRQLPLDKEMLDDAIDKKNLMLEVLGKDKMDEDQKEKFIKKYKEDHEYQLRNDEFKTWGTIGIGYDVYSEIIDNSITASTGQYTQDYMGNKSQRFLLPKDQENIGKANIVEWLYGVGLLPRDLSTLAKNVIKLSKKNSLTENQYEKYKAVGKETGAKVTGWKMDLTKSKSKLETTVSEIEWIEEHGGLTEKQGKEYVKLSKAVDEVSYRELQKIQSGKTADQIINAYSKK